MKRSKVGNAVMGKCAECGRVICYREDYVVRPEVWAQAGMGSSYFNSGFLHRACLEKRLGRPLTDEDFFAWSDGTTPTGNIRMKVTQEGAAFLRDKA